MESKAQQSFYGVKSNIFRLGRFQKIHPLLQYLHTDFILFYPHSGKPCLPEKVQFIEKTTDRFYQTGFFHTACPFRILRAAADRGARRIRRTSFRWS